ncbi:MAG TPA: flagellar hook capping FlgD N-terminal domain-containing protein [Azospirillum sp.]
MAVSGTDSSSNLTPWGTLKNTQTTTFDKAAKTTKTADELKTDVALKGIGDNFNNFLKLLTTQMQNQDPTKPMDTNEMTQQLVQFANVEQNIGTNSRLDKLLKLQQAGAASTQLAYLGRTVVYQGDEFQYAEGMTTAPLGYELETASKATRVDILDNTGRVVRSMDGETTAGTRHLVNWDFKDDNGRAVQPGTYKLNIAPKGETESDLVKTKTYTFGAVTGVDNSKDGEMLMNVNGKSLPWSEIESVR